jgi:hypothetical protein
VCFLFLISDATFTHDKSTAGFTIETNYLADPWQGRSAFGDTDADTALADLHDGIRWCRKYFSHSI